MTGNVTIGQAVAIPDISVPIVDPRTKLVDLNWYRFFETMCLRTGGPGGANNDLIANNSITINTKANSSVTIELGHGLVGGGNLTGNLSIEVSEDMGWTAGNGTINKGNFTSYNGQVMPGNYTQASVQTTDDAVKHASQRLLAIEEALRNNGGIDG